MTIVIATLFVERPLAPLEGGQFAPAALFPRAQQVELQRRGGEGDGGVLREIIDRGDCVGRLHLGQLCGRQDGFKSDCYLKLCVQLWISDIVTFTL